MRLRRGLRVVGEEGEEVAGRGGQYPAAVPDDGNVPAERQPIHADRPEPAGADVGPDRPPRQHGDAGALEHGFSNRLAGTEFEHDIERRCRGAGALQGPLEADARRRPTLALDKRLADQIGG